MVDKVASTISVFGMTSNKTSNSPISKGSKSVIRTDSKHSPAHSRHKEVSK